MKRNLEKEPLQLNVYVTPNKKEMEERKRLGWYTETIMHEGKPLYLLRIKSPLKEKKP